MVSEGLYRPLYTVQADDTFESMSDSYGGLVSPQQLQTVNGINATNQLENREILVIPLPCTCFNNTNNGETAVYLSYVVQTDEKLSRIGSKFGIIITELGAINELSHPTVDPGDILAIPISACSSANLNWYYESLIVPNGSYALTATNCIKCTCGPTDLKLQCLPSGVQVPCYNLKCKGSNLFIGEAYMNQTTTGCNVTACVYRWPQGWQNFEKSNKCFLLPVQRK
ncbi:lysM domain-containing GPI-anchored protein 1-like [Quillaja saponaria]|uniref:LysM domain-containing GPI-anchored protein 1-like n=1 Tax=Quillaja saponaria TaxID=32244 RepID=A0AAD7Q5I3_QUISA|nr:lysM domain-containing GPI-anchored protein 1-like [Quillaja saponaria]